MIPNIPANAEIVYVTVYHDGRVLTHESIMGEKQDTAPNSGLTHVILKGNDYLACYFDSEYMDPCVQSADKASAWGPAQDLGKLCHRCRIALAAVLREKATHLETSMVGDEIARLRDLITQAHRLVQEDAAKELVLMSLTLAAPDKNAEHA